jgi:signal transduction histidine kinase
LYRSPNLRGHDLAPVASGAIDHPEFRWTRTPKHTRMRVVDLHTHAVVDPEDWDEVGEPAPPAPPIRFVAAIEATDVDAFLSRLRRLISILGAASGLLLSVILGVVVRRSLRPLDDLADEIGKLSGTDLSTRVRLKSTPKEMVPVVDQLNQLLARLDEAFERERTFSADIAHELRTPLAGLRSTVDVAMSRPRDERRLARDLRGTARDHSPPPEYGGNAALPRETRIGAREHRACRRRSGRVHRDDMAIVRGTPHDIRC